ncbi:MAG: ABC transporter substrate-binding protein [Acidimicrobiia bacterium]
MRETMRRPIRPMGLLIALALVAAACGGVDSEPAATDTTAVSTTAAVVVDPTACNVAAPDSAVTINYLGWPFAATQFYAEELEKCEEVENISVNIEFLDFDQALDQMRLALSAEGDSPYDIIHVTNPEAAEFGFNGWLLPLNDLIDKYRDEYDLDDIPQSAWDGALIDGNYLGVPMIGDSQIISYRSDLFTEYGLAVPTNYDEIISACGVLADAPGIDIPFAMDFSAGWAIEIEFLAALRSYGGDYLVAGGNQPGFAGAEGVAALTKMKEVSDACMGDAHLTYGYQAASDGLANGSIAFISIWASTVEGLQKPENSDYPDVIKYAPAAEPQTGSLLGGTAWLNYYAIPAATTLDPELVFLAILEATDAVSQKEGGQFGVVTRESVTDGVPTVEAVNRTIADGVGPYEPNPAIALIQGALGNVLPFVFTGEMTPGEALDAAAEAYIAEATAQGYLP